VGIYVLLNGQVVDGFGLVCSYQCCPAIYNRLGRQDILNFIICEKVV